MQAAAGASVNGDSDVLVVKNDTPMNRVGFSKTEMSKFDGHVRKMNACVRSVVHS